MKKVRSAIGVAAGVAPVLGLMTPAASAAATATHAAPKGAKTVSLRHTGMSPDATPCTGQASRIITGSPSNFFNGQAGVVGKCILFTVGSTGESKGSRHSMLTQVYSFNGHKEFSGRVHSTISSGTVNFSQSVGVRGFKVCETFFLAKHPHKRLARICETR